MRDITEAKLLRAILDEPNVAAPRRIYADYLDDTNRSERAEFIRTQIRLSELDEFHPEFVRLHRREQQLREAYGSAWRAELPELPGLEYGEFDWGMVESVVVSDYPSFATQMPIALEHAPIQSVTFREMNPYWADQLGHESVLGQIRDRLVLSGCRFDGAGLRALLRSPYIAVWHLELDNCHLTDDGARVVADSPAAARLNTLSLQNNALGPASGAVFARPGPATRLRRLVLNDNRLGDAGMSALANSARLEGLESLALGQCGLTAQGLEELADSRVAPTLQHLDLNYNYLEEVAGLTRRLVRLSSLVLDGNPLGGPGLELLARSSMAPRLVRLSLSGTRLMERSVCAALEGVTLPRLQSLNLSGNFIGPAGCRLVAQVFPGLLSLSLDGNPVGDAGVRALAGGDLSQLVRLELSSADITAEGARLLLESAAFAQVREIDLRYNKLSPEVIEVLRTQLGDRRVTF